MTLTKVRNVSYQGVPAKYRELRWRGAHGLRATITRWVERAAPENGGHAAGTVVVQFVSGNWRRNPDTFRMIEQWEFEPPVTDTEVLRKVETRLMVLADQEGDPQ